MSDPRNTAATVSPSPRPRPFYSGCRPEHDRQIEIIGRALDEVVGAYVQVLVRDGKPEPADVRRLVAAARRLWTLAVDLRRRPRGCS